MEKSVILQTKSQTNRTNMKKSKFLWVVMLAFVAAMTTSCITPQKVRYLQDMEQKRVVALNRKFEAVISPSDQLSIIVNHDNQDSEMTNPFNNSGGGGAGTMGYGYLVDVNGNIEMPVLGQLHVAGLTRLQLIDTIKRRLQEESFMSKPRVDVRFSNFRIYILNAEGGSSISIGNERCTLLEALALSGAAGLYTRRDKIGVLREVDGRMVLRYLDPRSSTVFEDPFFMLQQNDIIITDSFGSIYFKEWLSSGWSVVTSVLSVVTSALAIFALVRK